MTPDELISYFNRIFGIEREWPKTFEVDAETYASCCQKVFDNSNLNAFIGLNFESHLISLGKTNKGLMFKNVELILIGHKK